VSRNIWTRTGKTSIPKHFYLTEFSITVSYKNIKSLTEKSRDYIVGAIAKCEQCQSLTVAGLSHLAKTHPSNNSWVRIMWPVHQKMRFSETSNSHPFDAMNFYHTRSINSSPVNRQPTRAKLSISVSSLMGTF